MPSAPMTSYVGMKKTKAKAAKKAPAKPTSSKAKIKAAAKTSKGRS